MSTANALKKAVLELELPGQLMKLQSGVGVPGRRGEEGQPGSGGDLNIRLSVPVSNPWVLPHGLGKYPTVWCFDSSDNRVIGTVAYDSLNQMTVTFDGLGEFSGYAIFN